MKTIYTKEKINENEYFRSLFKGIDNNIILDKDQIEIIKNESNCLIVIAGAGSGKTTTMAAKTKYFIDNNVYKNEEILIISYTNKAVNEIDDYINKKFKLDVDILTFHKFSLNILRDNGCSVNIISENNKKNIFKKIIINYKHYKEIKIFLSSIMKDDIIFNNSNSSLDDRIVNFSMDCINYLKTKGILLNNIEILFKNTNNINYKSFTLFIKYIYEHYYQYCKNNNLYDFDDLIIKSLKYISKEKIKYRCIIVDEYQDISKIRYDIIKKLKSFCKITVVGDDWQSIYSFSGSCVDFFLNFERDMNAKVLKIHNTYRNSQDLINIAGNFVMSDSKLIKKNLLSNKKLKNPIEFFNYRKNINNSFEKIIKKIIREYGSKKNILVLGRYNNDINMIDSHKFDINGSRITYINSKSTCIRFMTIHSSKGLGYDNVIIINMINGSHGFPSTLENNFFKKDFFDENNNFFEERRLFYVALTRTKNKVYILYPFKRNERSVFIKEIKKK